MSRQRTRAALSQNFLRDPRLADHLVQMAAFDDRDTIIEIGPGSGVLTARLAQSCRQLLTIGKDANLARRLAQRFAGERAVAIFATDFLEFPLSSSRYKVFANIPFAITTAIVSKLTTGVSPPEDSWLVIQREAAQHFLGEPAGTLVVALLHPWFAGKVRHHFRRDDFVPRPGVDVVLLHMSQRPEPLISREGQDAFRDLVTFAYTAWQPTVFAALASAMPTSQVTRLSRAAGCNLGRPPSALTGDEWVAQAVAADSQLRHLPATMTGAAERLEQQQATLAKQHRSRRTAQSSIGGGRTGR
jgi:23S rRNA (adenine-N6)-dimethyltransferase